MVGAVGQARTMKDTVTLRPPGPGEARSPKEVRQGLRPWASPSPRVDSAPETSVLF